MKFDLSTLSSIVLFVMFTVFGFLVLTPSVQATNIACTPDPTQNACIVYDYQTSSPRTWYFIGHGAVINITDTTDPPGSITAFISSAADTHPPYAITLRQMNDPANPHVYSSQWINFTSGASDMTKNQLHVSTTTGSNTVTVTYKSLPGDVADIKSGNAMPLPSTYPPQPITTIRVDCNNGYGGDTDHDSICNKWEDQVAHPGKLIITTWSNNIAWNYTMYCGSNHPANPNAPYDPVCPDPNKPDIYLEIDWMQRHTPSSYVLNNLTKAFANAPNGGVNLHIQMSDEVYHYNDKTAPPSAGANNALPTDFDKIKRVWFGTPYERSCISPPPGTATCNQEITGNLTAKRQIFHYALFAHFQSGDEYSSGKAEQTGNDIGIYLGHFTAAIGSVDQQEGALMHELGHNLGLYHGGGTPPDMTHLDYDNCKPNYLSVMSYTREFQQTFPINAALNYSSGWDNTLDKSSLDECVGVSASPNGPTYKLNQGFAWSDVHGALHTIPNIIGSGQATDWNADTLLSGGTCPVPVASISSNINNFCQSGGCMIAVCNAPITAPSNLLIDHDDWNNLDYNVRENSNFYDGAQGPPIGKPAIDVIAQEHEITNMDLQHVMDERIRLLERSLFLDGFNDFIPQADHIDQVILQGGGSDVASGLSKGMLDDFTKTISGRLSLPSNAKNDLNTLADLHNSFVIASNINPIAPDSLPLPTCDDRLHSLPIRIQKMVIEYENTGIVSYYIPQYMDDLKQLDCIKMSNGGNNPHKPICVNNMVLSISPTSRYACMLDSTIQRLSISNGWALVK